MKKINTLILIMMLMAAPATFAQLTHTPQGTIDETANAIIKKASAKMSSTVSFTVTVVNYDANKKETFRQKADIIYSTPRYRVNAGSLQIFCDGKSVWQLNKNAREVVITPLTTSDNDITNPAKMLANYSKNYRAKFIREDEDGTVVIDLQPYKSSIFHKVRFFIDGKTGVLKMMQQHNYDSSRSEYIVTNFKSATASDADFVYDTKANPGIEVIDMR